MYFTNKIKLFLLKKNYLCIIYTYAESPDGQRLGRYIYTYKA